MTTLRLLCIRLLQIAVTFAYILDPMPAFMQIPLGTYSSVIGGIFVDYLPHELFLIVHRTRSGLWKCIGFSLEGSSPHTNRASRALLTMSSR